MKRDKQHYVNLWKSVGASKTPLHGEAQRSPGCSTLRMAMF